jgi:hypothetical protein
VVAETFACDVIGDDLVADTFFGRVGGWVSLGSGLVADTFTCGVIGGSSVADTFCSDVVGEWVGGCVSFSNLDCLVADTFASDVIGDGCGADTFTRGVIGENSGKFRYGERSVSEGSGLGDVGWVGLYESGLCLVDPITSAKAFCMVDFTWWSFG